MPYSGTDEKRPGINHKREPRVNGDEENRPSLSSAAAAAAVGEKRVSTAAAARPKDFLLLMARLSPTYCRQSVDIGH